MKILVLDGFALNPGDLSWKGIKELGTTVVYDRTEQARILNRIGDAEIVLVNKCPITRETIEDNQGTPKSQNCPRIQKLMLI